MISAYRNKLNLLQNGTKSTIVAIVNQDCSGATSWTSKLDIRIKEYNPLNEVVVYGDPTFRARDASLLVSEISALNPTLVLIALGENDFMDGRLTSDFITDITSLVTGCKNVGLSPILIRGHDINDPTYHYAEYMLALDRRGTGIAPTTQTYVIDTFYYFRKKHLQGTLSTVVPDGINLNDAGHEFIYQQVKRHLTCPDLVKYKYGNPYIPASGSAEASFINHNGNIYLFNDGVRHTLDPDSGTVMATDATSLGVYFKNMFVHPTTNEIWCLGLITQYMDIPSYNPQLVIFRSPDAGLTWIQENDGQSIIFSSPTSNWCFMWNGFIWVDPSTGTFHLFQDSGNPDMFVTPGMTPSVDRAAEMVGTLYSYSTPVMSGEKWLFPDFETNKKADWLMTYSATPHMVYVPERNALMNFNYDTSESISDLEQQGYYVWNGFGGIRLNYCNDLSRISETSAWQSSNIINIYEPGMHIADPSVVILPNGKMLIGYNYDQGAGTCIAWIDLTPVEFYDMMISGDYTIQNPINTISKQYYIVNSSDVKFRLSNNIKEFVLQS